MPKSQASALATGAWNGLAPDKRALYERMAAEQKLYFDLAHASYLRDLQGMVASSQQVTLSIPPPPL